MDWSYVIINAIVLACIYGTLAISVSITWSSLGLTDTIADTYDGVLYYEMNIFVLLFV